MLDFHIAELYGVKTKVLVQAVKRNLDRFPTEFMFQVSRRENDSLRSQIVTSKAGRGGRRYLPFAFTEHGVAMLSSVLNSDRAIAINILIVKAFVKLRDTLALHKELAQKLALLETKMEKHDEDIQAIIQAMHQLMTPPNPPKRRIGFGVEEPKAAYRITRSRTRK
jgi:hypothetical protein